MRVLFKYKVTKKIFCTLIFIINIYFTNCVTTVGMLLPHLPERTAKKIRDVTFSSSNLNKNISIIALSGSKLNNKELEEKGDSWLKTLEASVSKGITDLGFFNIIDISNKLEKFKETNNQTSLSNEAINLGKELQINSYLIVSLTKEPKVECKIEEVDDSPEVTVIVGGSYYPYYGPYYNYPYYGYPYYRPYRYYRHRHFYYGPTIYPNYIIHSSKSRTEKTGVTYVSIYVEGKLLNLKTSQVVTHFFSETIRVKASVGDTNCPSSLGAFDKLLKKAGYVIARNLSPEMIETPVPLLDEIKDIKNNPNKNKIKDLLAKGISWAKSGSFETAFQNWNEAKILSNDESFSANWNIAIYFWHIGEINKASKIFNKLKKEKYNYITSKLKETLVYFDEETNGEVKEKQNDSEDN